MTSEEQPSYLNQPITFASALASFIQQATEQASNQMVLKLYAHRFSVQAKNWLSNTDCQEIEPKLEQLIVNYCQYLPMLMQEFGRYCDYVGWRQTAEQANSIIASFFEKPERNSSYVGLIALLDKVYFAHRLFEELNDYLMCQVGSPTSTWNMTTINLLVHQMLGSEFSSRLDMSAIEISQKLLADAPEPAVSTYKNGQSFEWPCFCQQQGLNLGQM